MLNSHDGQCDHAVKMCVTKTTKVSPHGNTTSKWHNEMSQQVSLCHNECSEVKLQIQQPQDAHVRSILDQKNIVLYILY